MVNPESYIISGLPDLNSMILRRSKRTVVLENRRKQKGADKRKKSEKNRFCGLYNMFTLCTASVIVSSASALPTTMAQKVVFHTGKIKSNFDGTRNSLNYSALLCSAVDNDTYTFKEILHQPDAKDFV